MPLCFAYGSNMDRAAMAARCPGSRAVGLARLPRHRLAIMREGYLTVAPDPRGQVHGLLWDVALADMPALDRYEAVAAGLYAKRLLPVLAEAGPRRAVVYVGRDAGPGEPRPGYLDGVLAAARAVGLPREALAELASLGPVARAPAAPIPAVRPTRRSPLDPQVDDARRLGRWEP